MGAQTWMYGLILYFVGVSTVWALATQGISDTQYSKYNDFDDSVTGGPAQYVSASGNTPNIGGSNQSVTADEVADVSVWSIGKLFRNIFSLYAWNISIPSSSSLYSYLIYIKLIFIWLPGIFLIFTVIYSLPTMGG